MRKKYLLMFSIAAALSLTGCQSNNANAETEALQEQIAQLQQQISDLEQKAAAGVSSDTADPSAQQEPKDDPSVPAASETGTDESLSLSDPQAETAASSDGSSALSTTYTIEELTSMVSAYEEKADAAAPSGSASDDMEQFLTLKQEEKKIDNDLDIHEDELEYLYRNNTLTREEYRSLERELERLEDRLDAAEDKLEYTFGIDD